MIVGTANLQKMFQLIGYGEQAGSGVPKIYRNWKQQLWQAPDLKVRFDPDMTELDSEDGQSVFQKRY